MAPRVRKLDDARTVAALLALAAMNGALAATQELPADAMVVASRSLAPRDVTDAQLVTAIKEGLHREEESAVALVLPRDGPSIVLVLIRKPDGSYVATDISQVETAAFGFWGRKREEYERWETTPLEWLPRDDDMLQLRIRTRAWRGGTRYTATERLIIKPDGTPLFR